MKYYVSECNNKLIQYNPESQVYKIRNNVDKIDTRLSKEQFDALNTRKINKSRFYELLNIYFKNVKHEWIYDDRKFRKIPNFEADEFRLCSNYNLGVDIPFHTIPGHEFLGKVVLVYHHGKVYYHTISYNGYKSGQLVCPKTFNLVRWAFAVN